MSGSDSKLNLDIELVSASFKSKSLEHTYRQYYQRQDGLQAKLSIIIASIAVVLYLTSDYQLFGNTLQFQKLVIVRAITILLSIVSLIAVIRYKEERSRDFVLFFWILILCTAESYFAYTRPMKYGYSLSIDIALLVCIYSFLPNRLILQLVAAVYFSSVSLYLYLNFKEHTPISARAVWASVIFANLCGLWICWRSHTERRRQYGLLLREKQLANELQGASNTIKTLRHLLPICASCKNVRDDEGYWCQVEDYLLKHSDIGFSHGICPNCFQKLYPDFAEKIEDGK